MNNLSGHCEWCNLYVHVLRRPSGILNVTEDEAGEIPHVCALGDLTKEMVRLREIAAASVSDPDLPADAELEEAIQRRMDRSDSQVENLVSLYPPAKQDGGS